MKLYLLLILIIICAIAGYIYVTTEKKIQLLTENNELLQLTKISTNISTSTTSPSKRIPVGFKTNS